MEARMFGPGGARAVLAVSRMVAADLAEIHGVPPGRTRVLYNPVDTARFHPGVVSARGRIRALHGIPRGALVCLFSAHHFRLKGLYPLLRAAARRGPKAPFVLVLGGGRKARWERLAVRLGLGDRVVFAGSSAEPEAYYGAADAFVLPTFYDPCSLSVLEAMACALPVVTSRWNGASEWIEHGREGWILDDPSRDDLLASALEELEDPGRRRETGGRARARVLGLSPEAHLESVLNVYGDVMAEKAGRRS
jgi:UDP-glucose:(heptosyl)LPS alpha-1,3-glucosyltransferase